jgi:hypothetical protein
MTPATLGIPLTACASRPIDHTAARIVPSVPPQRGLGTLAKDRPPLLAQPRRLRPAKRRA